MEDCYKIYNSDCTGVTVDSSIVKCVVTDPPYRLTSGGRGGSLGGCLSNKVYDNSGSLMKSDVSWNDVMSIIDSSIEIGDIYVMSNNRNLRDMLVSADSNKLKFHNILVWDKKICTPNRWYMKNLEFAGYFYKGKARKINNCSSKQLTTLYNRDVTTHPTEKPVELMRQYIENSTNVGDVVFDPFMGSGTTGVAALSCGRKFIGVEIDEKWFNIAQKRLEETKTEFCS